LFFFLVTSEFKVAPQTPHRFPARFSLGQRHFDLGEVAFTPLSRRTGSLRPAIPRIAFSGDGLYIHAG
jgi:hypothetical protein